MEILNTIVWTGRSLVLQFADDHHAFHEDAKLGDLSLQLGTSSFSSWFADLESAISGR